VEGEKVARQADWWMCDGDRSRACRHGDGRCPADSFHTTVQEAELTESIVCCLTSFVTSGQQESSVDVC